MKTLQEYLTDSFQHGSVEHSMRSSVDSDGNVSFYIHPMNVSGDTLDFAVAGNDLVPLQVATPAGGIMVQKAGHAIKMRGIKT
jgi:hypothetical protein